MLDYEIWKFKSINMGRELEIAGEFIYESAKKMISISGLNNSYELNVILYMGSVGIERLQKICLCLFLEHPLVKSNIPECLYKHNHSTLEEELVKYTENNNASISINGRCLLELFVNYYNNFRYANFDHKKDSSELRSIFISFLKKKNKKFDFDSPFTGYQFKEFKRFYIDTLGQVAKHYYSILKYQAHIVNIYPYEIDANSNAAKVFWLGQDTKLYSYLILEQESIKELLLFLYKKHLRKGVFKLLDDVEFEPLDIDEASINEYIGELCNGKVSEILVGCVSDLYNDIQNKTEVKERKELLELLGNRETIFDDDEDEVEDFDNNYDEL